MPQPFSRIIPDAHIRLDPNALEDKPDMAILVTKIFATWASIERELSFLLVRVLGADAKPALAMYGTLTAQHLQNSALQAAAEAALPTEDNYILLAVLAMAEAAQTPRNHLAHWTWARCEQRPDLLALADPKMIKERDLRVTKFFAETRSGDPPDITGDLSIHLFDDSGVLGYSKADLKRALRDLAEVDQALFDLSGYLEPNSMVQISRGIPGEPVTVESARSHRLEALNGKRLFREALARIRASRQKPPQSPASSPQSDDPGS